jgi:hypothetical protein
MIRRSFAMIAMLASIACSSRTTEANPSTTTPTLDAFTGAWRSVTPSLEFVRLTIAPKSSEQDALAARLTFSGVAMEGSGRIAGDSLVIPMLAAGSVQPAGVLVAHLRDGGMLAVQVWPPAIASVSPLDLTLVREN